MSAFLSPKEVAAALVDIGKKKVSMPVLSAIFLGMFAGVYIGFGAQMATVVATGTSKFLGFGVTKMLVGAVFSVGLMLVIIAGAELFTGNNLIVKAFLKGEVTWSQLLKSWVIIYFANFLGSLLLVFLIYQSGLWASAGHQVGATALKIANAKVNLTFTQAFVRAILCNWMVCLAVWLAIAGKDIVSKIFGILFPIMTFVACGYEHCIANMYFIPMGILLKFQPAVTQAAGLSAEQLGNLNSFGLLVTNLIPVTLGNILGGGIFVGGIYYYVYCRE